MIGTILNNTYRLEKELSAGGMGQVYVASHLRLKDRRYAIKRLLPELAHSPKFSERFVAEAKAMMGLDHPNIVRIEDFLIENNTYFLVMEFVESLSLAEKLHKEGKLSPQQIHEYLIQLLNALDFCHARGIVHRDLKPANLLIARNGSMKVSDFGIARQENLGQKLTNTGMILGTPEYMSPEQIVAEQSLDGRSDIYSTGIIFYEMLTGSLPFPRNEDTQSTYTVMYAHINNEVPSINDPSIPQYLLDALKISLAKLPNERFQTAKEFKDFLQKNQPQANHSQQRHQTVQSNRPAQIQDQKADGTAQFSRSEPIIPKNIRPKTPPNYTPPPQTKPQADKTISSSKQIPTPVVYQEKNKKPFFLSFFMTIFVIALSFAGYYWWHSQKKDITTQENPPLSKQNNQQKTLTKPNLRKPKNIKQPTQESNVPNVGLPNTRKPDVSVPEKDQNLKKPIPIYKDPQWPDEVNVYCKTMLKSCFTQCMNNRPQGDPAPAKYCQKACWLRRLKSPFRELCVEEK